MQRGFVDARGEKGKGKNGVREVRTLDLRITQISYETYALANCATTPLMHCEPISLYLLG